MTSQKPNYFDAKILVEQVLNEVSKLESWPKDPVEPNGILDSSDKTMDQGSEISALDALKGLWVRSKSASGNTYAFKTAIRRLSVAFLAIIRGYMDNERELNSRLIQANELLSRQIDRLNDELKLIKTSYVELLEVINQLKESSRQNKSSK
jgi:hypothetical protein